MGLAGLQPSGNAMLSRLRRGYQIVPGEGPWGEAAASPGQVGGAGDRIAVAAAVAPVTCWELQAASASCDLALSE